MPVKQIATGLEQSVGWRDGQSVISKLANRPLFFYVGAGLSTGAGLVGWKDLASTISDFRRDYEGTEQDPVQRDVGRDNARYLQEFIDERGDDNKAILSRNDSMALGRTVLMNILLRFKAPPSTGRHKLDKLYIKEDDLELHSLIWQTQCQGVFTTNYDMLLEQAFLLKKHQQRKEIYGHSGPLRSYRYNASFLRFLMSNPRFVLKLHGDINDIGTMIFDPYSLWDCPRCRMTLEDSKAIYAKALQSGNMVYIGSGLRDKTFVELHSHWRNIRVSKQRHQRVALVPRWEIGRIKHELKELGKQSSLLDDMTLLTYGGTSVNANTRDVCTREVRRFLKTIGAGSTRRPQVRIPESQAVLKFWQDRIP